LLGSGAVGSGSAFVAPRKPEAMPQPIIDNDRAPAPRFLTLDRRIPEVIRRLLEEADGCASMSFAVGGSSCVRLAIRKTFELEALTDSDDFHAAIGQLGEKHPSIAPSLFQVVDRLGAGDDPLEGDTLKALIATFKAVLYELYVLGEERRETLAYLSELLQALDSERMLPKPRTTRLPRQ
jgi:hypothetical protein